MKRKIFLFLILSMLVFMTGCTNDIRKENKHILDFLLNNVVDDNGRTSNNQFYMFSKDGKFIYNKSTKVRLNKAKSILFIKGTWTLEGNNLILKQEEMAYQSLDATKTEYKVEYTKVNNTIEFKDLKIKKDSNGVQYLNGDKCAIMKKLNDNKEYLKEIRYYLRHDINNVDLEKLKKLET